MVSFKLGEEIRKDGMAGVWDKATM